MSWCCFSSSSADRDRDQYDDVTQQGNSPLPYAYQKSSSTPPAAPSSRNDSFFVITAIYNPASFSNRYVLYHKFAEHMRKTGAQLITIECIFPHLGQHEFQVTNAQNPYHIQIRSKSIYWMKESLINIAVSRLPFHAKWVCWLDADISFHESNWIDQTIRALQDHTVVQVFKKAHFLGSKGEILRTDYSFGYSVAACKPIDQNRYDEWYPHPGYGWAMSRSTFVQINGLPDYDIVGSGDLHFAFSLINRVTNALEQELNPAFKQYIIEHSRELFRRLETISQAECKSIVGYAPLTISHHWHGSRKDRQYVDRWKILIAHNFNYVSDVVKTGEGLLEFTDFCEFYPGGNNGAATVGCTNSLQSDILTHFGMRNEDRSVYNEEDVNVKNGKLIGKKKKKDQKPQAQKLQKKRAPPPPVRPHTKGSKGMKSTNNRMLTDAALIGAWHDGDPHHYHHHDDQDEPYRPDPNDPDPEHCPCPDYDDGHGHHCPCPPEHGQGPDYWHGSTGDDGTGANHHQQQYHQGYQSNYGNDYNGAIVTSSYY